ncbi:hypothetical protein H0H92_004254 [Tricholoma furcatifolium]|nr:hypothetical protein H0H92_004254 [Tricholoma furcatifolium]
MRALQILGFGAILHFPTSVLCLWPIPTNLEVGTSFVKLASTFDITLDFANAPQDLLDAVSRTKTFLSTDKLERLVVGRGQNDSAALVHAPSLSKLSLSLPASAGQSSIAEEAVKPIGTRSEGYSLHIPADGTEATLQANSTLGLFRGLTTFGQLWYQLGEETFPVSDIKRTLDAMSWVKINTFHWHVVDSQSFPLEIPGFPELSGMGAYSSSEVYSSADVQDIVAYAGARGIDVLMEIDTPGHTTSIAESHPEHIACAYASPWASFANEPPAGQLRIASPATLNFTSAFITAIAETLPSGLFSTGGDEVNENCYVQDAQTQEELGQSGETLEQALDTFVEGVHEALKAVGKVPVVWEEMVLEHNVTLQEDTVVMVWISSEDAAAVVEKNFRIVHAPSNYFYLDCGAGEWIGDDPTGNSWCDPFKTWSESYTFDPYANITDAQKPLVLGGQQLLWTEQSSPENLDSIVWPRAASSAEASTRPPENHNRNKCID